MTKLAVINDGNNLKGEAHVFTPHRRGILPGNETFIIFDKRALRRAGGGRKTDTVRRFRQRAGMPVNYHIVGNNGQSPVLTKENPPLTPAVDCRNKAITLGSGQKTLAVISLAGIRFQFFCEAAISDGLSFPNETTGCENVT
ncbi:hypothetical protein NHG68_17710 [Enterobacter sp. Z1]|nr:hypothetical protein NHG68_17710 [Enterobacter sp. Z1]